jgi:hypothetical protein
LQAVTFFFYILPSLLFMQGSCQTVNPYCDVIFMTIC